MVPMARGLSASPQTKFAPIMILASISGNGPLINFPKRIRSFSSLHLRFSCRFLCTCNSHQHATIDMSKYREAFANRMAMAGLKPHHRLAVAVSGGADSMALCVLASLWKRDGENIAGGASNEFVDGLLAIVVDHGLRTESKDEANLVCNRVQNMGVQCEVVRCEWSDGRPKKGHLQEAAREKRYEILQDVCIQHHIGALLIAHHADDQAELFILRLSRGSGVLGLAGMAFVSQLFPKCPDDSFESLSDSGLLLVRPLLEFSKEDMYQICQGSLQEWVEDPTNRSPLFARNRIRMSLNRLPSSPFKLELQAVISVCRRTRLHVEKFCYNLINQAITVMLEGYAVIDLKSLNPSDVDDICLTKLITSILQFISQKHKPIRGSASKLLLDYFRTFPCKTCLTAAGCYLCPSPGSKGSKILVCCSIDSSLPLSMEMIQPQSTEGWTSSISKEVEEIVEDGKSFLNMSTSNISDIRFLDVKSSESVLLEANRLGILCESTYETIISLQKYESENFKSKTQIKSDPDVEEEVKSANTTLSTALYPGKVGYFMNRFKLKWNLSKKMSCDLSSATEADFSKRFGVGEQKNYCCCVVDHDNVVEVRRMVDTDWLYLAELTKCQSAQNFPPQVCSTTEVEKRIWKINSCTEFLKLSALGALQSLKSIPAGARRGLPVLVDSQGLLLSIPVCLWPSCSAFLGIEDLIAVDVNLLLREYWLQALPLLECVCSIQAKSASWGRPQFVYLVFSSFWLFFLLMSGINFRLYPSNEGNIIIYISSGSLESKIFIRYR